MSARSHLEIHVGNVLLRTGLSDVSQLRGVFGGDEALVINHRLALIAYLVALHVDLTRKSKFG